MIPRITQNAVMDRFVSQAEGDYANLAKTQNALSTGNRVNDPGDDPYAATQIVSLNSQLGANKQFQTNVSSALGYLQTQDSTMSNVSTAMDSIQQIMIAASSVNQNDPSAVNGFTTELAQIKQSLLGLANTQYGTQGYMFAGTATGAAPYQTATGNAYQGNAGTIATPISPGTTQNLNLTGDQVFGASGTPPTGPSDMNIFDLIDQISADITAGNVTNTQTLNEPALKTLQTNLHTQQAVVGAREQSLQSVQTNLSTVQEQLTKSKSDTQGVDLAQATIDFQTQSNTYQAALQSGTMMMKTSILNFLS